MVTLTSGTVVFVEADEKKINGGWQKIGRQPAFLEAIQFGTMKSMGGLYSEVEEITKEFKHNGFNYHFIIKNHWGPCYIKNLTTGKTRELQYFHLKKDRDELDANSFSASNIEIFRK